MALLILVYIPPPPPPPPWQLLFRVKTIDGANIGLTCGLSEKLIDALNSYGSRLLNKHIPVAIDLLYDHIDKIQL